MPKLIKNEGFTVVRERHTTGEMHFPLLVFTLSCSPKPQGVDDVLAAARRAAETATAAYESDDHTA